MSAKVLDARLTGTTKASSSSLPLERLVACKVDICARHRLVSCTSFVGSAAGRDFGLERLLLCRQA